MLNNFFEMNWYYTIWSDALHRAGTIKSKEKYWKYRLFVLISMMNALNYFTIQLWLKYFNICKIPYYEIRIFNFLFIDSALSFLFNFLMPFMILNYLLVFATGKHKYLEKKEAFRKNISLIYSFLSIGLAFLSVILYGFLNELY